MLERLGLKLVINEKNKHNYTISIVSKNTYPKNVLKLLSEEYDVVPMRVGELFSQRKHVIMAGGREYGYHTGEGVFIFSKYLVCVKIGKEVVTTIFNDTLNILNNEFLKKDEGVKDECY